MPKKSQRVNCEKLIQSEMAEDYLERLRDVFDLFDRDKRGFITVHHFAEAVREHFRTGSKDDCSSQESISGYTEILDPDGKGEICFTQFCKAVKQILELEATTGKNEGCASKVSATAVSPDDLYDTCNMLLAADSKRNKSLDDHAVSNQPCDLIQMDDVDSGISCTDDLKYRHLPTIVGDRDRVDCCSEHGLTEYTGTELMRRLSSSDVRMSASHSLHCSPVSFRRITPSSVASQLYHASPALHDASGRSSASNVMLEDIDGNFLELNDKVNQLENQVSALTENQRQSEERQAKIKDENVQMIDRVHSLEEQLRDMEVRSLEQLVEEQRKCRELLLRLEKDKSAEIEMLMLSYTKMEREYAALQADMSSVRSENERLYKESSRRSAQIDELYNQLSELVSECDAVRQRSRDEILIMSKERDVHTQLVEELGKELDDHRAFRMQWMNRPITELEGDSAGSHCRELEELVISLKQENAGLRDQIEDLQSQLLHHHVEESQLFLKRSTQDFTADLDVMSRGEILHVLKKEQESNQILRNYVEQITLRILENNPSILEIASRTK